MDAFLANVANGPASKDVGGREFLALVAENSGLSMADVFLGLADGYKTSPVNRSLCRLLGLICQYLTPTGALIVVSLGIFQALQTIKALASSILSGIMALVELYNEPGATITGWVKNLFSPTKKDATSDALVDIVSATLTAELPPAILGIVTTIATASRGSAKVAAASPSSSTPAASAAAGSSDLANSIAAGIVSALGTTSDSNVTTAIRHDVINALARGQQPNDIRRNLVRKYQS